MPTRGNSWRLGPGGLHTKVLLKYHFLCAVTRWCGGGGEFEDKYGGSDDESAYSEFDGEFLHQRIKA